MRPPSGDLLVDVFVCHRSGLSLVNINILGLFSFNGDYLEVIFLFCQLLIMIS